MKTYIQIGANIGKDDFHNLVTKIEERLRIVLVEPNTSLIGILTANYNHLKDRHDIIICPYGIALHSGTAPLHLFKDTGHSSLLNRSHRYEANAVVDIKTKTFLDLCSENGISEIEYLSIDTEGLDYEILNSIDLSKIIIKTITFEKWNIDNDDCNGTYRTGEEFLNSIRLKYNNYTWYDIVLDNMPSYKLMRNIWR